MNLHPPSLIPPLPHPHPSPPSAFVPLSLTIAETHLGNDMVAPLGHHKGRRRRCQMRSGTATEGFLQGVLTDKNMEGIIGARGGHYCC